MAGVSCGQAVGSEAGDGGRAARIRTAIDGPA
jgi:hypothetical protein